MDRVGSYLLGLLFSGGTILAAGSIFSPKKSAPPVPRGSEEPDISPPPIPDSENATEGQSVTSANLESRNDADEHTPARRKGNSRRGPDKSRANGHRRKQNRRDKNVARRSGARASARGSAKRRTEEPGLAIGTDIENGPVAFEPHPALGKEPEG